MTLTDILALTPGFAGLALSIFLLWRTELRQARMSLKLLAPPDAWTVSIARRGSPVQATDPVDADYVSMRGIFAVSATNDGPRGGALWNLAAEVKGLDGWRINWFHSGQELPYSLPGRSCDGWSQTAISIACDFETLGDGLREFQVNGAVSFRILYTSQGWRGRPRVQSTSLVMTRTAVLTAFRKGSQFIDLATCQVVPRARALATELFSEFDLADSELDVLTKWALTSEAIQYVKTADGLPGILKIAIKRPSGQIDQGWAVGSGRSEGELDRIIDTQRRLTGDIERLRAVAVRI